MPPLPPETSDALAAIVGPAHVLTDADRRAGYEVDWTGRFRGETPAVIRPGSVEEVAAVVQVCNRHRIAIVPQGGNTGLVGGGVPLAGELVLSLGRLRELGPVDHDAAQVTAGAGVTIADLRAHARGAGMAYAVDLAARDTATVGGTIATNAGGLHFLRSGGTRQQLVGVEAVLGDASIVRHVEGLQKDNTGYDLAGLLCGSEGTLGVITAARLGLVPARTETVVALVAFDDVASAVAAVGRWRRGLDCLDAAELFLAAGLRLVCGVFGLAAPFRDTWPVYVLLEASAAADPTGVVAAAVQADTATRDAAVARDRRRAADLWRYREEHTAAINTLGPPHKLDVTVPFGRLAEFVETVPAVVSAATPGARTWLFGHVGDGNIHVNVTGLAEPSSDAVDAAVLEYVASLGGSISAEHGIGTAKRKWLHLNRSPAELAAFGAIKHALDPNNILNPNVLLP